MLNPHYVETNLSSYLLIKSTVQLQVVSAPNLVEPHAWPEGEVFGANYNVQVERVYLVEGEALVVRKDVVKKGTVLARPNSGGKLEKGKIYGTFWRELEFEAATTKKNFELESSHITELLRQFVSESDEEVKILGVKVLHLENNNGKVRGKVLVNLHGNIAKTEYLKEIVND